jgi:hypothetical protein
VPVQKLTKVAAEVAPVPDTENDGPENTIIIHEDGDATIKGKKILRLTTFWLVCQHTRVINGKTVVVKAHLRGPNRDCDVAKAALAKYLVSGHDKIYDVE